MTRRRGFVFLSNERTLFLTAARNRCFLNQLFGASGAAGAGADFFIM
jgi:hypothetical protein